MGLEPNRIQLLNKMEAALGLMRRIHPKHSETALSALLGLLPHLSSDLLSQVDQPLQVSNSLFNSVCFFSLDFWTSFVDCFRFLIFGGFRVWCEGV